MAIGIQATLLPDHSHHRSLGLYRYPCFDGLPRGRVQSQRYGPIRRNRSNVKKTHTKYSHNLSFAIVPDIRTKGAFDEAVKGVDGVVHTASPFVLSGVQQEKGLLIPAIEGTKSILLSISAHAPQVKRVVVTSSFAAILNIHKGHWPEHTYTEEDWNPETYDGAKNADHATTYCASKKLAEKAAFDYVEGTNPAFSIATICPPMVYGPLEHNVTSTAKLNTLFGRYLSIDEWLREGGSYQLVLRLGRCTQCGRSTRESI